MVSLHIEPTSRCTLACPRCERTTFLEKFGKKNFSIDDLNISVLENFIDTPCDDIILCGNVGDPIYHREFIKLVKMLTQKCQRIVITTNGSYKSRKWWRTLNSVLRTSDEVQFSIDGLPENFTKYRVNADWDSIQVGIQECVAGPASTIWKYIPFSYNEHDIAETRELSQSLGIDKFKIYPSDRWLIDDPLRPSNPEYIGPLDTVQQKYKNSGIKDFEITPLCASNSEHYIGANGYYTPCCMSKNYEFYYKSDWWKNQDKHDIRTTKLTEQIRHFTEFYSTIQTERYDYCVFNCGNC